MAYQTISSATPTTGVELTGHIRLALVGMNPADAVALECSEDDFTTVELVDTIRYLSHFTGPLYDASAEVKFSGALYEPRPGVKYRLAPLAAPVGGSYKYSLGGS